MINALDFTLYPRSLVPPLSFLGLIISLYVWYSQRSGKPIACWTRDCDRIIRSPYSRLLGIHNSAIGFWVFLFIFFMTLLPHEGINSRPYLASFLFVALILLSFIGTLVSLYLTYIQLFVLKGICNWCITSAVLILTIFILTMTNW